MSRLSFLLVVCSVGCAGDAGNGDSAPDSGAPVDSADDTGETSEDTGDTTETGETAEETGDTAETGETAEETGDTGPQPTCTDGEQNGQESGIDCGGPCVPCQDCVPQAKRVFLTSQTYAGDLMSPYSAASGLAGADGICQLHADNAGLSGTFGAWLSDSTADAIDRVADVGPWYLPDRCTRVFATKASITFSGPEVALNVDEHGVTIHPAQAGFWSGTDRFGHSNGFHCDDWTNDSPVGLEGGRGSPYFDWDHESYWTDFVTSPCDHQESLLCVER